MTTPIPIAPTISRIGQIFVNVKDLDRAISFYRNVLGMQFLFQAPPASAKNTSCRIRRLFST